VTAVDPPEKTGNDQSDAAAPDSANAPTGTASKLKAEQARVLGLIADTRGRLERARPHSPLIDATFRAIEHDVERGGIVLAGAVAFRVFLFLVPYVFVLVVGFGVASDAADTNPADAARSAGIGGLVANAVGGAADLSGFSRAAALVVGLIALVFGTRALLKVLRIVYGLIWGVQPPKLQKSGKAMLAIVGLATAAFVYASLLDDIRDRSPGLGLLGILVSAIIPFSIALLVNVYLPHQPTRWPDLIPGAIVLTIGVLGLHLVTVYWIAHQVESKTDTYGAIGAALAILLWAYFLGRLITASAVVNASLWQRRKEHAERRAARLHISETHDPNATQGYTPRRRAVDKAVPTSDHGEGPDGRTERAT
jgi:membrane protein